MLAGVWELLMGFILFDILVIVFLIAEDFAAFVVESGIIPGCL